MAYRKYYIRCYTCNTPLAHLKDEYEFQLTENHVSIEEALNVLGLRRYCCRSLMANPAYVTLKHVIREKVEGGTNINNVNLNFNRCQWDERALNRIQDVKDVDSNKDNEMYAGVKIERSVAEIALEDSIFERPRQPRAEQVPIEVDKEEIKAPTSIGMPVINETGFKNQIIDVGFNKKSEIISGRTYLAR